MEVCEDKPDGATDHAQHHTYECVICGQISQSSEERPVGLIVLMLPSTGW